MVSKHCIGTEAEAKEEQERFMHTHTLCQVG